MSARRELFRAEAPCLDERDDGRKRALLLLGASESGWTLPLTARVGLELDAKWIGDEADLDLALLSTNIQSNLTSYCWSSARCAVSDRHLSKRRADVWHALLYIIMPNTISVASPTGGRGLIEEWRGGRWWGLTVLSWCSVL